MSDQQLRGDKRAREAAWPVTNSPRCEQPEFDLDEPWMDDERDFDPRQRRGRWDPNDFELEDEPDPDRGDFWNGFDEDAEWD